MNEQDLKRFEDKIKGLYPLKDFSCNNRLIMMAPEKSTDIEALADYLRKYGINPYDNWILKGLPAVAINIEDAEFVIDWPVTVKDRLKLAVAMGVMKQYEKDPASVEEKYSTEDINRFKKIMSLVKNEKEMNLYKKLWDGIE